MSCKETRRRRTSGCLSLASLVFVLVAAAGCPTLFESQDGRITRIRQAAAGRDGARTIRTANTIVNSYSPLVADVRAGATVVTVRRIADLTAGTGPLSTGDLVLVIQMAGASIDSTDTETYGNITALGNAGRYEFAGVESIAANQITLACPLKNSYSVAGKVQVIRVPQYTTLTIDKDASVTAPAWNGQVGGVVAAHAVTAVQLDGGMDVSAKGFRGGAVDNNTTAAPSTVTTYRSLVSSAGAEKGEGIAGYQANYDVLLGRYGRGAPANGGGGGDAHNAGGGGGANARSGAVWNGQGVMLASVMGASAWALDPGFAANGNLLTSSEGGGRGGYSYSNMNADPLASAPGDPVWGGDYRRSVGGLGGRPLDNNPAGRLFMGGGGGAGDGNNNGAGRGGRGGGLVFLIAGSISGSGTLRANGEAGVDSASNPGDAPGGGGGGGAVVVHAVSATGISVLAEGGPGGNQTGLALDAEGPGGGGGGGYIAVTGGAITRSTAGGPGGTTNRASMTAFPSDGATAGNFGQSDGDASTFLYCGTSTAPDAIIATHPPNPTNLATGDFAFESSEAGVTFACSIDTITLVPCSSSYTTSALVDGSHTLRVAATDLSGNTTNSPTTFSWVIDTVAPDTSITRHPSDPSATPTGDFTFASSESPATFACRLDGGVFAACSASYTTPVLANGSHTLAVRSMDQAGNLDPTPATFTWTVDTAIPVADGGSRDSQKDTGMPLDAAKSEVLADAGAETTGPSLVDAGRIDTSSASTLDAAIAVQKDAALPVPMEDAADGVILDGAPDLLLPGQSDVALVHDASQAEVLADATMARDGHVDGGSVVLAKDAANSVASRDAGGVDDKLIVLGSGFCSVTRQQGRVSPWPFLLALAGLALVARRRR